MEEKSKRAILIDSKNKTVSEYHWTDLKDLQKAVDGRIERCESTELLGHSILIDEECLMYDIPYGFHFFGCHQPFAGCALVVGDSGVEFTETAISIQAVEDFIDWTSY